MIRVSTIIFILLAFSIHSTGLAQNRCDPNKKGFFQHLNCDDIYQQRIDRRLKLLHQLDDEFDELNRQKGDLLAAYDANEEAIHNLELLITHTEERVQVIREMGADPRQLDTQLSLLIKEADVISKAIDTALLIESGCRGTKYTERRVELIRAKSGLEELGWFAAGAVGGEIVAEGAKAQFFPDEEKDRFMRGLIDAASLLATLWDGYSRIKNYNNPQEKVTYVNHLRANCA